MSELTTTTRRAGIEDVPAIAALFDMYRTFYGTDSDLPGATGFLGDRLARGESVVFLAERGGRPAGFVQLYPCFSSVSMMRTWILNDLFVHRDYRRGGVARALMEAAEAFAKGESLGVASGTKDIELKTERTNVAAQALYESRGWARDEHFYTYTRDLR